MNRKGVSSSLVQTSHLPADIEVPLLLKEAPYFLCVLLQLMLHIHFVRLVTRKGNTER